MRDTLTPTCLMTAWHARATELQCRLTRNLNDPVAAQDLPQHVFIKALRQGGRFCDVANARAGLFGVSRNTLTDHLRRHHVLEALPDAPHRGGGDGYLACSCFCIFAIPRIR